MRRTPQRQHGVVSQQQLNALGIERGAIAHRLKAGRLHRIHRGVYAVGHRILSLKGQFMAAALGTGDEAAISHAAAAHLHGLLAFNTTRIDVTSPRRLNTEVCGLVVDAYWPEHRLVVEVDSYRYHRSRRRFESDRRRDVLLQAAGIRAARFTDRRIEHEPEAVAEDLRRLVDSRPPHPS